MQDDNEPLGEEDATRDGADEAKDDLGQLRDRMARERRTPFTFVLPKKKPKSQAPTLSTEEVEAAKVRLEVFHCDALKGKLTRRACSRRWRRAKAEPRGRYSVCHGCPIGGRNSRGRPL